MPDERADLQRRKAVEVGANAGRHALNFRMRGGWVFRSFDDAGNRREDESRGAGKRVGLQLPDAVHHDIRRPHRRGDHPAGAGVSDLELFAGVADQNRIKTRIGRTKARLASCLLEMPRPPVGD